MEIFISKNSVFLIFCFFISVHICEGQISKERKLDLDRLAKNSKSQIIVINVPSGQPVSIHSVNGDINRTENGNFYVTNKTEIRNKIIRETARPLQDKNKTIEKVGESVIEAVLKNQDTSINNYRKICEFLKAEIPKNTETDFPLAIEQAYKLLEISNSKKDTFLLANSYALLFFLYSFKDFKDEATPYGEKIDSLLRVNSFNQYTLETFDLYSKGLFLLENYKKVIDVESRALKIRTIQLTPTHESVAKVYFRIARSYRMLQQLDSQNIYYEKALKILDVQYNQKDISYNREVYRALYYFKYKNLNDWNTSDKLFRKAIKVDIQLKDSVLLADDYCDLGVVYDRKKMADSSIFYTKLSLIISNKLNASFKQKRLFNYNLGCQYYYLNIYDSAYKYFKDALIGYEYDTVKENQYYINWIKYCMGISSNNALEYKESLPLLLDACKYYKNDLNNNKWEIMYCFFKMGFIQNHFKNYRNANVNLDSAIFWSKKFGKNHSGIHFFYKERAYSFANNLDINRALKDIDTAIYYFHNQSIHNMDELVKLMNIKSDFLADLKQYESAIDIQKQLIGFIKKDSISLESNYLKTAYKLTIMYLNKKDTIRTNSSLIEIYNFVKDKYFNDFKSCIKLAELCEQLNNNQLAVLFLNVNDRNIKKCTSHELNEKEDLLLENDIYTIKLLDINTRKSRIFTFDKEIKKNDHRFLEKKLLVNFLLLGIYFNTDDTILIKKITENSLRLIENNKDKIDSIKMISLRYPFELIDLMLKIYKNSNKSYFNEVISLNNKYNDNSFKVTQYLNLGEFSLSSIVGDYYFSEAKNYSESFKYFMEILKYIENKDEKISHYYRIVISDYYGNKNFTYIDSVLKYINNYNESKQNYIYHIASEREISKNDFIKANQYLNLITKSGITSFILLRMIFTNVAINNIQNAELAYIAFVKYSLENKVKLVKSKNVDELIRFLIMRKQEKLFNLLINELEKENETEAKLYKACYFTNSNQFLNAFNILKNIKFNCKDIINEPFLDQLKNLQDFKEILKSCRH